LDKFSSPGGFTQLTTRSDCNIHMFVGLYCQWVNVAVGSLIS